MRKLWVLLWVVLSCVACEQTASADSAGTADTQSAYQGNTPENAYQKRLSNIWVEGKGEVSKLLADDNKGARHQKFLVKISSGKTLLFAHNIDLASRIEDLKIGDAVTFRGEYVYNPKGGIVHWTHHDPSGRQKDSSRQGHHQAGWIKHNGKLYQ